MPSDPYDELFKNLTRMMEDLMKSLGEDSPFTGYTIIAGPGENPRIIRTSGDMPAAIPYEMVEGPDRFFITVELPSELTTAPYADIGRDRVVLHVEGMETAIEFHTPIDVHHSSYQVRHGILDVVCQKA